VTTHASAAINEIDPVRRRVIGSLIAAGAGAMLTRAHAAERMPILSRPIPHSGERLPVIGLGTWQEFDIGQDTAAREQATATLRTLVEQDLRVIDTSPMYGRAEAVVGELLEPIDRAHHAFIATKVWTSGAEAGRRQIENSFRLLRRDRLDLVQVHNLLDADTHLSTLRQMQKGGRVRYVGVTHYTASAHAALVRYIERGAVDFVQVNYSLVERDAEQTVLPAALAHKVAVLINRPLGEGTVLRHVRDKPLPKIAAEVGAATWAQFALKWIVSHPAVTCAIPGTRNPAHLLDNIGAAQGTMPDASMRAKMAAAFNAA
jgi:aryl-alcohol dehydrogenase-like predicted oxidoreductase